MSARDRFGYYSGYKIMWMLVMFDLPVATKRQARQAHKFREYLLDLGFERSQFSVYMRFCNGKEQVEQYVHKIGQNLPEYGDVHMLSFTDRQYENIVRYSGKSRQEARKNPNQLALF